MAIKTFDNDSSVQAHEGASQANTVPTTEMIQDAVLATDYRTADIPNGIVTVCNVTDGEIGRYAMEGGAIITTAIYANAVVTAVKDNAATLNVYVEAGVIKIQNKIAATKDVTLSIEAIGVDFK